MRRLLALVSAIVLVDTMLYAALVPLLPGYAQELGLSKTGSGLLVASYPAGVLLAGIPAGLVAARFGPRRAAATGLALIAAASIAFGFADTSWTLGVSRLVQGIGSALSWSGGLAWLVALSPRDRRGELLGTALAAAIVGALLGPVLGGVAAVVGDSPAFAAVALLAALLAVSTLAFRAVPAERAAAGAVPRAVSEPQILAGLWLMVLGALLFGAHAVLIPLELDAAGWSAAAIGAVFLVAAAAEAAFNPVVGRISDRRGRLVPVRFALVGSIAVSLALAWAAKPALVTALVLAAATTYGALFAPGLALLSDGAERAGVPQALGFGLMNAGWALGNSVGPSAAGLLGDVAGDAVAFVLLAGVCAATFVAVQLGVAAASRAERASEAG